MLATPADKMEESDVQLCTHGLMKLSKTGGLYAKSIERWNIKDLHVRQNWREFKQHFIGEYEKMLTAGGGTTMASEGYGGGAYNAMEQEDASSLAGSIVQYVERASAAEGKASNLESRLAALEMAGPPQLAYFMPQTAYNMQPGQTQTNVPPPHWQQQPSTASPATINVPPPQCQQQHQQHGRKRGNDVYN